LPEPKLTPSSFSGSEINRAPHFAGGRARVNLRLGGTYSVELWLWNGLPADARPVTGYCFSRGADGDPAARGEHLGVGGASDPNLADRLLLFNGNERKQVLGGRTPLGLRRWRHVVLVREGARVTLYLDGQREASGELELSLPAGGASVFLGGRCDNFANWEGKLDEVAVYRRALTEEEVATHFQLGGAAISRPQ
jgi:hypothetical protein